MRFIGTILGFRYFEDDNIPIEKIYPTGRKDGNKIGKRKRNLEYSGIVVFNSLNFASRYVMIHPLKVDELFAEFEKHIDKTKKENK